jgi:hypothetical protein
MGAEGKVGLHKDTHWKEEELMKCEQKIKVLASWTSRATYDDAITLEGVGDNISKVADRAAKNVVQTRVRQDITLFLPKQNTLAWALQVREPLLRCDMRLQPMFVKTRIASRPTTNPH